MEFKTLLLILCLVQYTISEVPKNIFIAGDSTADGNGANNGKTNGWGNISVIILLPQSIIMQYLAKC